MAVALAVYALIFALDRRFVGAGWLFGAAVAFQPLVLLMLPVLLAMAGRRSGIGLAIRSLLPAVILLAAPLIANFRVTLHTLVDQPSSPNFDHATPWTTLSPSLGGHGPLLSVAAGPVRSFAFVLAIGLAVWVARHWLKYPERLAWACTLALALRSYTESVMTDYYLWAALAIGMVVAARCSRWRFQISIVIALATTILAQWKLAWFPWWTIQIAGLTALLAVTAQVEPLCTRSASPARAHPHNIGDPKPIKIGHGKTTGTETRRLSRCGPTTGWIGQGTETDKEPQKCAPNQSEGFWPSLIARESRVVTQPMLLPDEPARPPNQP